MKIRDLLFTYLLLCISITSYSKTIKSHSPFLNQIYPINQINQANPDYNAYCIASGGTIITNVMMFSTRSGYVEGFVSDFCEIEQSLNLGMIGLETLASDKPSLAATYIKLLQIDTSKPIRGPFYQAATNLCFALGGSTVGFYLDGGFFDERGYSNVCYFGDGSHIATWTLYYIGIGKRTDVKAAVKAEPLNINIPNVHS